jgi:hypothetical protein
MVGTVYGIRSTLVGVLGTGINLVQCSFAVTGVATKAVDNAGYVYYYGNGAFPGLASGYTGVFIAPYTAM